MSTLAIEIAQPKLAKVSATGSPWIGRVATGSAMGGILALAAALRLFVLWVVATRYPHDWLFHRGIELGIIASNLADGKGFSSPYGGVTGPTALLAPGYPAMVAVIFRLFGNFTFASEIAVLAMQILFSLLTILVMMRLARRMMGAATANLAGIVWAVSMPLLWMPTIFWETCLSTLLLAGFASFTLHAAERPSPASWIMLGAICGGATLINPALILALLAMMGWAACQVRNRISSRYAPLLGLLAAVLIVAPWIARNQRVMHAFIPVRSCFGFELWNGNQHGGGGLFEERLHPIYNRSELALYTSLGEVDYMHRKMALGKEFIRRHPAEFLWLTAKRVAQFWSGAGQPSGGGASDLSASNQSASGLPTGNVSWNLSWIIVSYSLFTTLFGLTGLTLLFLKQPAWATFYALPLLIFPLPYYITHADVRCRLALDPLLTILAAYAIMRMVARLRRPAQNV